MLAALGGKQADRLPCSFMIFGALRKRTRDQYEFVERALEMGLDAFVELPVRPNDPGRATHDHYDLYGLPVRFTAGIKVRDWGEKGKSANREYTTPSGTLSTSVAMTDDWVHGLRVPLFDDYIIPRATKRLVSTPRDLAMLRELLAPPTADDIAAFREEASRAKAFAEKRGLLVVGEWGVLFDAACWLCGMEELAIKGVEEPEFLEELLSIIGPWNLAREALLLEEGVDLLTRRAWYETVDFLSPDSYRLLILPWLKKEIAQAHQAGAKLGGITTSCNTPFLDMYLEAGLDTLIGLDPVQDRMADMALVKRKLGGKMGLWGGVNSFVTVEQGTADEVRKAVQDAARILSPGGGFILSPVDNIREDSPRVWENVKAFIDAWKELRG